MTEKSDMNSVRDYDCWRLCNNWAEIKALEAKVAELLAHRDKLQRDSNQRGEVLECSRCHAVEAIARVSGAAATFIRIKGASAPGNEVFCTGCLESVAGIQG